MDCVCSEFFWQNEYVHWNGIAAKKNSASWGSCYMDLGLRKKSPLTFQFLYFLFFSIPLLKCCFHLDEGGENLMEIFQKDGKKNCSPQPICSAIYTQSVDTLPSNFSTHFAVRKNVCPLKCWQVRETVSLAAPPTTMQPLLEGWWCWDGSQNWGNSEGLCWSGLVKELLWDAFVWLSSMCRCLPG